MYLAEHGNLVNHLIQALKAESLYKRDNEYAVIDGEVKIIDEFTGRILEGRRWSEGLHQAVEAKEGVGVREENQTLATITLQNYFRMYDKLAGMTGTALTEANEFMKIYKLAGGRHPDQPADGPRRPQRPDLQDQGRQVGRRRCDEIKARHEAGPAGAGRHDLGRGLGDALRRSCKKSGVKHAVLNAKPEHAAARGRDDRRGGPAGRGHDRDQHGRPRRRHQARRQRGAPDAAWSCASSASSPDDESWDETYEQVFPKIEAAGRRRPREGQGARRPVHPRHRAPRVAPHRQPAARPLRPPGRPGRVALLPVRRGRPRAPVRRRPHLPHPRPARPRGRRGPRAADRGQDALAHDRERAEEGRAAELPDPQARARVRRRDEPAARGDLQVPREILEGRDMSEPAKAELRGVFERIVRGVHAGRLRRGLGHRRRCSRRSSRSSTRASTPTTSRPRRSTATSWPSRLHEDALERLRRSARRSWARS